MIRAPQKLSHGRFGIHRAGRVYEMSCVSFHTPQGLQTLVHSCTIFLCCLDGEIYEIDDPYRNPNMNNKDHRVGLLTTKILTSPLNLNNDA